ncbi:MAG: CmpA/NrtA family ABC transporter substrate-binding protein [Verrucomicrobiales bacterium]
MPSRPRMKPLVLRPPRTHVLRLGFIAVSDCAPLLVARELGFFSKHQLDVKLSCEVGWGTIREKLVNREIDAAHALAGLVLAMRLGINAARCEVLTGCVLSLHGNAITLSHDLWRRGVRDAPALLKLVRSTPQRLITLAVVSRVSSHYFLMRRWLSSAGIDPERDVRLVVLPPSQMVASLEAGLIDGFCVGEPWNSAAIAKGVGWCAATSEEIHAKHPEKILLTTAEFARTREAEHLALIVALGEACAFCDDPRKRPQVAEILRASGFFNRASDVLDRSLVGPFELGRGPARAAGDFHIFHRHDANRPTVARGRWLLEEFSSHVQSSHGGRTAAAELAAGWREDIYLNAISQPTAGPAKPLQNHRIPTRNEHATLLAN